jgi:hypothetical protein
MKHGAAIYIDAEPLRVFEGWYVIVVEREPEDVLLYIPHGDMRELMEKHGEDAKEYGKVKHHEGRRFISIYRNRGILERYRDPSEFLKAVKGA